MLAWSAERSFAVASIGSELGMLAHVMSKSNVFAVFPAVTLRRRLRGRPWCREGKGPAGLPASRDR